MIFLRWNRKNTIAKTNNYLGFLGRFRPPWRVGSATWWGERVGNLFPVGGPFNLALFLLLAATLLPFAGCTGRVKTTPPEEGVEMAPTTFSVTPPEFRVFPIYRIAPGDMLDILFHIQVSGGQGADYLLSREDMVTVKFTHAPELNEQQKIRPDGSISLPFIGEVQVLGMRIRDLEDHLKKRYDKILRLPELYVIVSDFLTQLRELKRDLHTASRGLSRLVTVRPDGIVTFPMVGDMLVADRSIPDVLVDLKAAYHKISPNLNVDLFLEKHSGSIVHVLGEVKKAGAFPISKPITVTEAIALAESFMPDAKRDNIMVVRRHKKKLLATRINLESTLNMDKGAKFFYLFPDDIVYVPSTGISTTAQLARHLADILFFRGWSVGFSWELHKAKTPQ